MFTVRHYSVKMWPPKYDTNLTYLLNRANCRIAFRSNKPFTNILGAKTMFSQILFYGIVLTACLILGNEMLKGVRRSINQMQTVTVTMNKVQDHDENIR